MLRSLPIKYQLIIIIALTSAITLAAAFSAVVAYDLDAFRKRLVKDMGVQGEIIADNSSAAIAFGDKGVAQEVLASLSAKPEIEHAILYLKNDRPFVSYSRGSRDPIAAVSLFAAGQTQGLILTSRDVMDGATQVGRLKFLSNTKEWEDRKNTYFSGLAILTLVAVGMSTLIGFIMQNLISKPLKSVADTMSRVTRTRDYGTRLPVESRDEVGVLVNGLNTMLAEIESSTERLQAEVHERMAKEVELHISQQELADFFESAPLGLVLVDSKGKILQVNRAETEMLGIDTESLIGRQLQDLSSTPQLISDALQRLAEGEVLSDFDVELVCEDGSTRQVELNANALFLGSSLVQARFFTKDVTLVRQAEKDHDAKVLAERANQAKTEFLSRMSHELRTPLNAILGFGQLLEMERLEDRQKECVDHILKGGRHLLGLINEVLNISRIEAGDITVSVEAVQLGALVREVMDLVAPLGKPRSISLKATLVPDAPLWVKGDRQRLSQVLINLVSNAVKYNVEGGSVIISATSEGGRVSISVTDTGPGIPDRLAERLFIPFDRLGAEQTGIEGSGLGLAFSKALAEVQGGKLYLDKTHEGRGARFVAEFPEATAPAAESSPEMPAHQPPLQILKADEHTILVIEDNEANIRLFEQVFLGMPRARLLVAAQGGLGIQFAEWHKPDLILLDANLPDMHGSQIAAHLRGNPDTREIPIIVVSADATEPTKQLFREHGVLAYLPKPVNVRELLGLADQVLKKEKQKLA